MKSNHKTAIRYTFVLFLLLFLAAVGVVFSINTGSVDISPLHIFKIIFFGADPESMASNVIWKIRLPRLLTAALLGGALSISGFLLQTFFRNPIASPFVLGISSGAKMCVGFVIIFVVGSYGMISSWVMVLAAFFGSLLITGFVFTYKNCTTKL